MDGILPVYKPVGVTSFGVVKEACRAFGIKKIGHAGTLDPFASGLLPLCIGKGRKIVEYMMGLEKEYEAVIKLGEVTDTGDHTGRVTSCSDPAGIDAESVRDAISGFVGHISQKAPLYSALKVDGVPMYKLARMQVPVIQKERPVYVKSIDLAGFENNCIRVRVICSKGTYIRSLAVDIGERLGTGGHLTSLERTRVGSLKAADAIRADQLRKTEKSRIETEYLRRVDEFLDFLPCIMVDDLTVEKIKNGQSPAAGEIGMTESGWDWQAGGELRILDRNGRLVATAVVPSEECEEPAPDMRVLKLRKVFCC